MLSTETGLGSARNGSPSVLTCSVVVDVIVAKTKAKADIRSLAPTFPLLLPPRLPQPTQLTKGIMRSRR